MSTLFVRIFFFFWVAMTLIGVAFGAIYVFSSPGLGSSRRHAFTQTALHEHGLQLKAAALREASEAKQLAASFQDQFGLATGLLHDGEWAGETRVGDVPAGFIEAHGRTTEPVIQRESSAEFYAIPLGLENPLSRSETLAAANAGAPPPPDGHWVVIATVERTSRLERYLGPDTLPLRLAVVFVISGLVCFMLARFLTQPIRKVREVARELARGDLTARVGGNADRNSRDELAALAGDIDSMAERLAILLESERRLLADVSHELRSPLARLNVAVEIARGQAGPEAADTLDRIQREGDRLARLVDEVLTLSRLDAEVQTTDHASMDLGELVAGVVADANYEATASNRSVAFEQPTGIRITGDTELMRRAIDNVVRNAIHFTAEDTTVRVTLQTDDGRVRLRVRDEGPGVPDEDVTQIFRPFYRVEKARERTAGGTGLGLAISARAVRLHGGTITATNETDPRGLLVEIQLPPVGTT